MPAELFALFNAFFYALHHTLTKKGLKYSNPPTAVLFTLSVNVVVLWTIAFLFLPVRALYNPMVFIFILVGLFQPGLTRLLTYKGIEVLGVSVTDPLRATTPLFGAFFAILLLGERMTLPILAATVLIVVGVVSLSHHPGSLKKVRSHYIFYPLFASLLAGFSQILRKYGLGFIPYPALVAAVAATTSLTVSSGTVWIRSRRRKILVFDRKCVPFYLAAGLAASLSMLSIYSALDLGLVVVVVPISSTGPLFALALSAIFLRDVERVTLRILLGALLIIAGVLIITLWR